MKERAVTLREMLLVFHKKKTYKVHILKIVWHLIRAVTLAYITTDVFVHVL